MYQPTLDVLELKKGKCTDYVLSWKSKGVFNSKFKPICTAFLHSIKLSEYRIGIEFDEDPLAIEQNNYLTKIVNFYIVYYLDAWSKVTFRGLTLKNCLFEATNIVKNRDKEKYVQRYGLAFGEKDEWNFGNVYARNVIIFGVDNSSSSHTDNLKNNFLISCERDTFSINGSFGAPEKKFSINFSKANIKFVYYNADDSYMFVNGKEIFKFKADIKHANFSTQFCLGILSNRFSYTESRVKS